MRSGVIAQKLGMTRVFTEGGEHVPVTVLKLDGCSVVAHRTKDRDGYVALQLGAGKAKPKNVSKAERERFAVAKVEPRMKLVEFRVDDAGVIPVALKSPPITSSPASSSTLPAPRPVRVSPVV